MKTLHIIYNLDLPYIEEPCYEAIQLINNKYYLNIASENINTGNRKFLSNRIVNERLLLFKKIIDTFDKVIIEI